MIMHHRNGFQMASSGSVFPQRYSSCSSKVSPNFNENIIYFLKTLYYICLRLIHIRESLRMASGPWNFLQNWSYLRAQSKPHKYKKIEIMSCILSDHKALKLELKNKSHNRKYAIIRS
jgi:hypothetical protein